MSMTKGTRPIDANNLARRIREYMDDFPNATTRLVTCRAILSMLGDETQTPTLRPITSEQVEQAWRGEWIHAMPILGSGDEEIRCSKCGNIAGFETAFCHYCGAPITDEAVDMVMERLEALHAEN